MKKIKLFIASMIGAIALVFAAVLGTKVNAANITQDDYSLSLTAITVSADKAIVTQEMLGENNQFLTISDDSSTKVSERVSSNKITCIEIVNSAISVNFNGTGTLSVSFASTGGSNESHFGLKFNDNYVLADTTNATLITTGDDKDCYSVTGTSYLNVTYNIAESGTYYLTSPNGVTSRGCRINSITMTDLYGDITYYTVIYKNGENVLKTDDKVIDGSLITYSPAIEGYYLEGWYLDEDFDASSKIDLSSYTVTSNITLFANFVKFKNYVDQSNMNVTMEKTDTVNNYGGSIFDFNQVAVVSNTGTQLPTGQNCTHRVETSGETKNTSARNIEFTPTFDCVLTLWVSSSNTGRSAVVYKNAISTDNIVFSYEFNSKNELTIQSCQLDANETYYIGGTNGYYIFGIFVEVAPAVSTPVLEQQESVDGSSIRYIATIETEDTDSIVAWNATYTLEGQTEAFTTADFTTLYKAVAGTNGKAAATNTYYLVLTLKDIPSKYNNKELTCTINVKLEGGKTISSNTKTYTLNVA